MVVTGVIVNVKAPEMPNKLSAELSCIIHPEPSACLRLMSCTKAMLRMGSRGHVTPECMLHRNLKLPSGNYLKTSG